MPGKLHGHEVIQLGKLVFDLQLSRLSNAAGEDIFLRLQSARILKILIDNIGSVVSKERLMAEVWPDVNVTDDSLTQCISDVRRAIGDRNREILRAVPKQGYILNAVPKQPDDPDGPQFAKNPQQILGQQIPGQQPLGTAPHDGASPVDAASDGADPGAAALDQRRPERRHLTVLACELVGLAALSTRLDPEDLREVMALCHRRCAEIIERRRGYVAHVSGDGVLAYFGYARADEYDAERAVEAGLELVEAASQLSPADDISFAARVGVATGVVVVGGSVGSGARQELAVVGATPNLAVRLRALAEPGTVVIASETQNLTGGLFDYRDLGSVALPDFAKTVPAWRVLGRSSAESRFEALRTLTTPLVGREEEIEIILRRWAKAKLGEGGVVLLSGEPGIGKSRIADFILQRPSGEPHSRLRLLCSPHHQDSALHPLLVQLGRAIGFLREDADEQRLDKIEAALAQPGGAPGTGSPGGRDPGAGDAREAAHLLADLLSVPTGGRYAPLELTPHKRKGRTLRAVISVIDGLAARRPLLLLCEDVHWIDPTTLEVLDLLVDRVPARRVLLIVTFRPEFVPSWVGRPEVTLLSLSRLPPRRRMEMIAHITGGKPLPREIIEQISDRTDGVPLFIEELTKAVVESDLLKEADGQYMATIPVGQQAIPTSLQESLLARLDRLASARVVAQTAAAIGRQFSHELVDAVAEMPRAELEDGLAQLVDAELIFRRGTPPDAEYRFKHALVQETAYGTMLRSQRQALHAHIAQVLTLRFPEMRAAEPELLAYHFTQGGRIAEAVPLWAAAGQRAAAQTAHAEAVSHWHTALDLAGQLPADGAQVGTRLQLLVGLIVSLGASRGYAVPEVAKALAEARAICDTLGNVPELFAVYHGMSLFLLVAGDLDGSEEMARRCMAIGDRTGRAEQLAESEGVLGYVLFAKGELVEARKHLEHAAAVYAEHDGAKLPMLNTHDTLVHVLSSLMLVLLAMGEDEEAACIAASQSAHSRSLGRPFDLVFGLSWLAFYELLRGKPAQALPIAEQALEICREHGYPLYELVTASLRSHALGQMGQAEQVLTQARSAVPAFASLGMMHFSCFYLGEVAALQEKVGDVPNALQTIDEAIAAAHRYGDRYFLSPLHRLRAEILARDPRAAPAQAAAALEQAVSIAETQGAWGFARRAAALRKAPAAAGSVPPAAE